MPGVGIEGSGGTPNALPSRGRPSYGTNTRYRDLTDTVGGARGPAALPSRTTTFARPAPPSPGGGAYGAISFHRGPMVEDAGAPRVDFSQTFLHGTIPWSRPVYANHAGVLGYHPPTQMPSWTADAAVVPSGPLVPIPVQNKRIANFTVRHQFGSTRELFNTGSLAQFVSEINNGMFLQGRRWLRQAKTANPWLKNLSAWGAAGSFGQTTAVLPTAPTNVPWASSGMGVY